MELNAKTEIPPDYQVRTFFTKDNRPIGEVLNEHGVVVWTSAIYPNGAKVVEREGHKEISVKLFFFFSLLEAKPERKDWTEMEPWFADARAKGLEG